MAKNKERIMAALLTSRNQKEAAELCGVSERTINNYLHRDDFRKEYEQRKAELVTGAAEQLQKSLGTAIDRLNLVIEDNEADAATQVKASRTILEYALKYMETQKPSVEDEYLERAKKILEEIECVIE